MNIPVLPDFTRHQWASIVERQWFAPLVNNACYAYTQLERLSVASGLRKYAWQFIRLEEFVPLAAWAQNHGLVIIPTSDVWLPIEYSSTTPAPSGAKTNAFRAVFCKPEDVHALDLSIFQFENKNIPRVAEMLGFPTCCARAFESTWSQQEAIDTTWEQVGDGKLDAAARYASTLLRWMGLRYVPHLPCSFHCDASQELGMKFFELGLKSGFVDEMLFIREALNWPMYSSRLFGIAEHITPCLKIVTRSTWTPTKEEFTVSGSYTKPEAHWWTDNGFTDPQVMMTAHNTIIAAIKDVLPHRTFIMDLGCGNGMLLRRLKTHRPDIRIAGIDINEQAIAHIPTPHSFQVHPIENLDWISGLSNHLNTAVIINPIRLVEMTEEQRDAVALQLTPETDQSHLTFGRVFVYIYGDVQQQMTLEECCAKAGLKAPRILTHSSVVTIGVLE